MDEELTNLVENLETDLEWAEENEWDAPISLAEDLSKCIDFIRSVCRTGVPDNGLPMFSFFMEYALRQLFRVGNDVRAIVIGSINNDTSMNFQYWNCEVIDKILFAGCIQQDATLQAWREEQDEDDGREMV